VGELHGLLVALGEGRRETVADRGPPGVRGVAPRRADLERPGEDATVVVVLVARVARSRVQHVADRPDPRVPDVGAAVLLDAVEDVLGRLVEVALGPVARPWQGLASR